MRMRRHARERTVRPGLVPLHRYWLTDTALTFDREQIQLLPRMLKFNTRGGGSSFNDSKKYK